MPMNAEPTESTILKDHKGSKESIPPEIVGAKFLQIVGIMPIIGSVVLYVVGEERGLSWIAAVPFTAGVVMISMGRRKLQQFRDRDERRSPRRSL